MRSKTSIELFGYWNRVRGNRPVPRRQEIEPGDIRHILPDLFILEHVRDGDIRVRLAGTNICNLFGRELRGARFDELWADEAGHALMKMAADIMENASPAVVTAIARTAAGDIEPMEMSLLPLTSSGNVPDRLIGALTCQAHPRWPNAGTVTGLSFDGLRFLDPATDGSMPQDDRQTPAASTVCAVRAGGLGNTIRRVLHLRVLDGGRAG